MPRTALIISTLRRLLIVLGALYWVACGSKADESPGGETTDLTITRISPSSLVPGNDLFFIYTHNWKDDLTLDRMLTLDRRAAIKFVYTHRF